MECVNQALILLHNNFLLCFDVLHRKTIASVVHPGNTATKTATTFMWRKTKTPLLWRVWLQWRKQLLNRIVADETCAFCVWNVYWYVCNSPLMHTRDLFHAKNGSELGLRVQQAENRSVRSRTQSCFQIYFKQRLGTCMSWGKNWCCHFFQKIGRNWSAEFAADAGIFTREGYFRAITLIHLSDDLSVRWLRVVRYPRNRKDQHK